MPRNPKAAALARAAMANANFQKGRQAQEQLSLKRREAMCDCLEAGCSISEVARLFGVSRATIWELSKKGAA